MKIISLAFCSLMLCFVVQGQIITTVAGTGAVFGYDGIPGPATAAAIGGPMGAAFDSAGNYYFVGGHRWFVYKLTRSGIISIFAGVDTIGGGYSGDGGPASAAQLCAPFDVTVDKHNNVFISDACNNRIRKVTPSGIITTFAGDGILGHSGDGGPATAANLSYIGGIAVDKYDNVFIYESWRVRKIDSSGIITTIAGDSISGHSGDGGQATAARIGELLSICTDTFGNLYLADQTYSLIRKIDRAGIITTVAGTGVLGSSGDGGPATAATFRYCTAVYVAKNNAIYISDGGNNKIRRVGIDGIVNTICGTGYGSYSGDGGSPLHAEIYSPSSIALDAEGNVYIGDGGNGRVRKITYTTAVYELHDSTLFCSLHPNPSAGQFTISFPGMPADTVHITVYNALGTKVKDEILQAAPTLAIELDGADGMYLMHITSGTRKYSGAVFLQH